MADIDNNLAVNSPLAILANRELDETGPRSWSHAPDRPGLLLEAKGGVGTDALKFYPQIVFEDDGLRFYCDHEEIEKLGASGVQHRFYNWLRLAYDHYCVYGPKARRREHRHKPMLKIQRVERLLSGEWLPPRIFTRQPVSQFTDEVIFELKYHLAADDQRILEWLSHFNWGHRAERHQSVVTSPNATVRFSYSLTDVLRAVAKIGFNLLAFHCQKTFPSIATFERTIGWIKDCDFADTFGDDSRFGHIHPIDVASLGCPSGAHAFRLTHDHATNIWQMYAAFFGGKAAIYVAFKGPNAESWSTMDVIAPYDKPMHSQSFKTYSPLPVRVTKDHREMIPSILWTRGDVIETRTTGTNVDR